MVRDPARATCADPGGYCQPACASTPARATQALLWGAAIALTFSDSYPNRVIVQIKKSIAINFLGGSWNAALLVATTPWFVSRLGLEGYGLIGFWMVLFYVALIFDFGLGSTLAREFARCTGRMAERYEYQGLMRLFERPVLLIGLALLGGIALAAPWIAQTWLTVTGLPQADVITTIRWMAVSLAGQFVSAFYLLALGGLQKQGLMVSLQVLASSLRYLGGVVVIAAMGGINNFFAFQGIAAVAVAVLSRVALLRHIGPYIDPPDPSVKPSLRKFAHFSAGMFLTALFAAAISNADRLVVSKLLAAEMLGRYTVAATAIGLLQLFIFAFHRVYQPRFTELSAAGDLSGLRRAYYQACMTVGAGIIPLATIFIAYTPEVFSLWLGWTDQDTTLAARVLVFGFVMAGLMWLPASYQQAMGWTRLNAWLMAVALVLGLPLLVLGVRSFGLAGAAALMLTHGLIQITLGLWVMSRVCFPGESLLWLRRVVLTPVLLSLPITGLLKLLMPTNLDPMAIAAWLTLNIAAVAALTYRDRDRIRWVESPARQR